MVHLMLSESMDCDDPIDKDVNSLTAGSKLHPLIMTGDSSFQITMI
ncbi:MAG: hypothetical protein IPL95_12015 [Saprospiraceae bacterium]|nr:hypothetical protein [Saprospiraceae bacterium]